MIFNSVTGGGIKEEDINAELLQTLDPDFKADNIAEGVDLFGLVGTMSSAKVASGTVTSTRTALGTGKYRHSASVSGLGFKPEHVMLVSSSEPGYEAYSASGIYDTHTIGYDGIYTAVNIFSEDGFEIYRDAGVVSTGAPDGSYYWVAWSA